MNSRFGVVYSVVTVLFFIAIAIIFVLRLNAQRDENITAASTNLQLIRQTAQLAFSDQTIPRDRFIGAMHGVETSTPSLLALVIYRYSGGVEYVWARNDNYLSSASPVPNGSESGGDQPNSAVSGTEAAAGSASAAAGARAVGVPTFQYNEYGSQKITDSFDTSASQTYFVAGLYSVLGNSDVFPLLRDSLVLILLYALGTLIITVLFVITGKARSVDVPVSGPSAEDDGEGESARTHRPRSGIAAAPASPGIETRPIDSSDGHRPGEDPALEDAQIQRDPIQSSFGDRLPNSESAVRSAGGDRSSNRRVTTASIEENLERRLTLELERSAYNDQNLTIVLARLDQSTASPSSPDTLRSSLIEHFSFEDLVFEYEPGSFCIILVNTELSGAIRSVEVFEGRRSGSTDSAERRAGGGVTYGLSARNGRLIEARQLLREAATALKRAAGTKGIPIVGFHSDPEKYREFIAGHGAP